MSGPNKPEASAEVWRKSYRVAATAIREAQRKLAKQVKLDVMVDPGQLAVLGYLADAFALMSLGQGEEAAQELLGLEPPEPERKGGRK